MERRSFLRMLCLAHIAVPLIAANAKVEQKFATGGILPDGKPYIIGERPSGQLIFKRDVAYGEQNGWRTVKAVGEPYVVSGEAVLEDGRWRMLWSSDIG